MFDCNCMFFYVNNVSFMDYGVLLHSMNVFHVLSVLIFLCLCNFCVWVLFCVSIHVCVVFISLH